VFNKIASQSVTVPNWPRLERGFHQACADLKPDRRWVVYPGTEAFPLASDIEAISLHALCQAVRGQTGP
jgi:hypothetical protein